MERELEGKVAVVTGSSQGIGRGIALELARAGCDVVITGRSRDKLGGVAAEIEALGRRAAVHVADLKKPGATAELVATAEREFGVINVLVCNAGAAGRGDFFTTGDDVWQDGFALKFFAHVRLCREIWPHLKASGGSIAFISGIGARTPVADYMIGASVVGASLAFMKALAEIGKSDGVQVNTVNPGSVDTDRFRHRLSRIIDKTGLSEAEAIEHHRKELKITRFGTPADIANVVRFMVSPRGSWMHGSAVDIDGGQVEPLRMSVYD